MGILHIVPGDSACGSLRRALQDARRDDEVLPLRDDLSCGPVDPDSPAVRAEWWGQFFDMPEVEGQLRSFWDRVEGTDDRLVVWFGRHCARDLALVLAWADRLGDHPCDIVDVTGLQFPFARRDGSATITEPAQSASHVAASGLRSLLGSEQPATEREKDADRQHWRQLRKENAPFRVVTEAGLASTPIDHFDSLLLERVTPEWRKAARVVGDAMRYNSEPYYQVGDLMLLTRIVALVEKGKLLADGDPWDMRSCRVRLADS